MSFLQPSFRSVTYDLIGDDNAPIYFRIDSSLGFVTLNTGLFSDSGVQYKVCYNASTFWDVQGKIVQLMHKAKLFTMKNVLTEIILCHKLWNSKIEYHHFD